MAGSADGVEEIESLVTESLTELKPLRHRERSREFSFLARLFLVDLRPLILVTGFQQAIRPRSHG